MTSTFDPKKTVRVTDENNWTKTRCNRKKDYGKSKEEDFRDTEER